MSTDLYYISADINVMSSSCRDLCGGQPFRVIRRIDPLSARPHGLRNEGAFGQFAMIGHGQPTPIRMSQNDVASRLVVDLITEPAESLDGLLTGADRQVAHVGTSTISSVMGGGIGSPCFLRLAR